jgi:hypothetical protein
VKYCKTGNSLLSTFLLIYIVQIVPSIVKLSSETFAVTNNGKTTIKVSGSNTTSHDPNQTHEVEMDQAHVTKETRHYQEASTLLEPTGSARARKTKNELAEKCGGRGKERRKDLEGAESLSKE